MKLSSPSEHLDRFLPMHMILSQTGHIVHAGPTLHKICGGCAQSKRVLELFEIFVPHDVTTMATLTNHCAQTLKLGMRQARHIRFRGTMQPLPDGAHWMMNLSFGISVFDAVQEFALCHNDFAITDPIAEMLYLREAQSAAMIESQRLNLKLQGAKIAAEEQAFTDTLTGLKNRRALEHITARLLDLKSRFAVLQIDLDFFKSVNDTMGHGAGDVVLQQVARILMDEIRERDAAIRLGGDEFVVLLVDPPAPEMLQKIAERIIKKLEIPIPYGDLLCKISGSIGITHTELYDTPTLSDMLEDVDYALYACKQRGRRCAQLFVPELRVSVFDQDKSA